MRRDHFFYTQLIVDEIKKNYYSKNLLIQSDLPEHQNPPRDEHIYIEGRQKPLTCIADVYARDDFCEPRVFILGEAKTKNDFKDGCERRDLQLDYYLNYLKYKKNGLLIYALPYKLKNTLKELISEKINFWNASNVNFIILTEMEHLISSTK